MLLFFLVTFSFLFLFLFVFVFLFLFYYWISFVDFIITLFSKLIGKGDINDIFWNKHIARFESSISLPTRVNQGSFLEKIHFLFMSLPRFVSLSSLLKVLWGIITYQTGTNGILGLCSQFWNWGTFPFWCDQFKSVSNRATKLSKKWQRFDTISRLKIFSHM